LLQYFIKNLQLYNAPSHSSCGHANLIHHTMASTLLKLTTILILLSLHSHLAFSNDIAGEDEEEYTVDSPLANLRSRSRFLATVIKKGAHCDPITRNVCNGVSANKGASLLHCCKKHCRNVLGDKNNCGRCGNKCKQGQRCCGGACIGTAYNVHHCGKCNKKCAHGLRCEYGYCGYA
jgi:hypothetical protein